MMGRFRFSIVVTFVLAFALTPWMAEAKKQQPDYEVAEREAGEPIMAIVSIQSQQVTFHDADGWILRAPVSTGTTGRETPAGIFAVLEKEKEHRSTMYDDARMPNMQRITWNGIALHGGPLPGYAASHGCVRMPYRFAEELFDKTRIGMRVIISPEDVEPIEFSHPNLFSPNAEALAAAPERAEILAEEYKTAGRSLIAAKKSVKSSAREVVLQKRTLRKLERRRKAADATLTRDEKRLSAAEQTKVKAGEQQQKAAVEATGWAKQVEVAQSALEKKVAAATDAEELLKTASTDGEVTDQALEAAKQTAKSTASEVISQKTALRKLENSKKSADAKLRRADKALSSADKAKIKAEERKQKASVKATELAGQVEAAKSELETKTAAAAKAKDDLEAAKLGKVMAAQAALDARLALEPVSVYISRATQMVYVRRNTHKPAPDGGGEVFDTSISAPVTILDPYKPIGTHIFTAMALENGNLRWTLVSIDKAEDPKVALDRVSIPQIVLDRIAPTALPRSSIIISDEPLSEETNYRTEFVTVLSDYPQGGFITRKLPPKVPVDESMDEMDTEPELARDSVEEEKGSSFFSRSSRSTQWKPGFVDL